MAKLTAKRKKNLPKSAFAIIEYYTVGGEKNGGAIILYMIKFMQLMLWLEWINTEPLKKKPK